MTLNFSFFFNGTKGDRQRSQGNYFADKMLINNQVTPDQFSRGFFSPLSASRPQIPPLPGSPDSWIWATSVPFKEEFSCLPRLLIPDFFSTFPLFYKGTEVAISFATLPLSYLSKSMHPLNSSWYSYTMKYSVAGRVSNLEDMYQWVELSKIECWAQGKHIPGVR